MNITGNLFHLKGVSTAVHGLGVLLGTGACRDESGVRSLISGGAFVAVKPFQWHQCWDIFFLGGGTGTLAVSGDLGGLGLFHQLVSLCLLSVWLCTLLWDCFILLSPKGSPSSPLRSSPSSMNPSRMWLGLVVVLTQLWCLLSWSCSPSKSLIFLHSLVLLPEGQTRIGSVPLSKPDHRRLPASLGSAFTCIKCSFLGSRGCGRDSQLSSSGTDGTWHPQRIIHLEDKTGTK